jgi:hypothetical protein
MGQADMLDRQTTFEGAHSQSAPALDHLLLVATR